MSCFLLLCGDAEPNLGPNACSICGATVSDDDKSVCCELCDICVHMSCDPPLSDLLYEDMVQQPSEDKWYCSVCVSNCSNSSECFTEEGGSCLSCICLNAQSILPKPFDLLAYICCHKVDVLVITETFWIHLFLMLNFIQLHICCFSVINLGMVEEFLF